ncbi:hypothetical protein G7072_11230 [Nocardioides sp. HDW12B]|uniref:hypothetical protein n=1 Tax=Nocardioides sp. HDW12B TaxID=2714939 RepID=UPI00140DF1CD|nr:hypothetical protein [Nocardioides sp. HDW12B]QIK66837.1 hypothetical protein G7072_11230 [Nocardioides sp. HDW12B]
MRIQAPTREKLLEHARALQLVLSVRLPEDPIDSKLPHVQLDEAAVQRVAIAMNHAIGLGEPDTRALAIILTAITEAQPFRVAPKNPHLSHDVNHGYALMMASTTASDAGLGDIFDRIRAADLVDALSDHHLIPAERLDAVTALIGRAAVATRPPRPRLVLDSRPLVQIGTPIGRVSRKQQRDAIHRAVLCVEVIENEFGMVADIPGKHRRPGQGADPDAESADYMANSALDYASGFVLVDGHLCGRGAGYAVKQMEDAGAPVFIYDQDAEPFMVAFGARHARRIEVSYLDDEDMLAKLRHFLTHHEQQIRARHQELLDMIERLARVTGWLSVRLRNADIATFEHKRLSPERARYRSNDPIHLGQAAAWELAELEDLMGIEAGRLVSQILKVSLATDGDASQAEAQPPNTGSGDRLSTLEWQALKSAQQLGAWPPNRTLTLLDDYMAEVIAQSADARQGRTHSDDWSKAYDLRFAR